MHVDRCSKEKEKDLGFQALEPFASVIQVHAPCPAPVLPCRVLRVLQRGETVEGKVCPVAYVHSVEQKEEQGMYCKVQVVLRQKVSRLPCTRRLPIYCGVMHVSTHAANICSIIIIF